MDHRDVEKEYQFVKKVLIGLAVLGVAVVASVLIFL